VCVGYPSDCKGNAFGEPAVGHQFVAIQLTHLSKDLHFQDKNQFIPSDFFSFLPSQMDIGLSGNKGLRQVALSRASLMN